MICEVLLKTQNSELQLQPVQKMDTPSRKAVSPKIMEKGYWRKDFLTEPIKVFAVIEGEPKIIEEGRIAVLIINSYPCKLTQSTGEKLNRLADDYITEKGAEYDWWYSSCTEPEDNWAFPLLAVDLSSFWQKAKKILMEKGSFMKTEPILGKTGKAWTTELISLEQLQEAF